MTGSTPRRVAASPITAALSATGNRAKPFIFFAPRSPTCERAAASRRGHAPRPSITASCPARTEDLSTALASPHPHASVPGVGTPGLPTRWFDPPWPCSAAWFFSVQWSGSPVLPSALAHPSGTQPLRAPVLTAAEGLLRKHPKAAAVTL